MGSAFDNLLEAFDRWLESRIGPDATGHELTLEHFEFI